jgi:hypothetical protein
MEEAAPDTETEPIKKKYASKNVCKEMSGKYLRMR